MLTDDSVTIDLDFSKEEIKVVRAAAKAVGLTMNEFIIAAVAKEFSQTQTIVHPDEHKTVPAAPAASHA